MNGEVQQEDHLEEEIEQIGREIGNGDGMIVFETMSVLRR